MRAGCVFVAGIHPSRTWTLGSFESVCAQTRPRFILSSERVFWGMEFEPMLTPREKSRLPENVPRGGSNPRRCGQWAQALPTELFRPIWWYYLILLNSTFWCCCKWPWPWLKDAGVQKSKNFWAYYLMKFIMVFGGIWDVVQNCLSNEPVSYTFYLSP